MTESKRRHDLFRTRIRSFVHVFMLFVHLRVEYVVDGKFSNQNDLVLCMDLTEST